MKTAQEIIILKKEEPGGQLTIAMIMVSNLSRSNARNAGVKISGVIRVTHPLGIMYVTIAGTILNR
jgi:hypothetical protein